MFEKKFITIIVLVSIVSFVGGVWLMTDSSSSTEAKQTTVEFNQGGNVAVNETSLDWGDIEFKGGFKEAIFNIKNEGDSTLKLRNVKTSCHCTKAQITIDGDTSPSFGMSGVSAWVGEVDPGEEAQVKAIFDPAYHGVNGLGPIERYIKVETSDSAKKYLEFMVKGVVKQ